MLSLFRIGSTAALLMVTLTTAQAHTPVEFLEVFSVEPNRVIEHGVTLQSIFDAKRVETELVGPKMFSRAVGAFGRPAKKQKAYLNWYAIKNPTKQPRRQVDVLDLVRGYGKKTLTIGNADFLLSPSQLITTGAPEAIPEGLDLYKAYRVVDPPKVAMDVELTESIGAASRKIGKPVFVCIPVNEWHHDEVFDVSHASDGFVVYELDKQNADGKVSTIDQFGLHSLSTKSNAWICVRAALLKTEK